MSNYLWAGSGAVLAGILLQAVASAQSPAGANLSAVQQAPTRVELVAQLPQVARINNVRVVPSGGGVNVVLETATAQALPQPVLTTDETSLTAEFAATLSLPQGEIFQADNPATGIERVIVRSISPNRVQVRILGNGAVPLAKVTSGQMGSTLAITTEPLPELEIIVTGTRTQKFRQNVPQSITTIDRRQLQQQFGTSGDIADALSKQVPGLAPPNERNNLFGQTLRGRNVTVLIDGIPQSTTPNVFRDLRSIDPSAIDRIEVLRGPTAIYGDGATGGVVNMITRIPTKERFAATTEIGVNTALTGNRDAWGQTIQQTFSGSDDKVGYILSGSFTNIGSFFDARGNRIALDPSGQGGLSNADATNLFGKLVFTPDPDRQLTISANRFDNSQDPRFTSDPIVNSILGRQRAQVLEGLQLSDLPGTKNSLFNIEYTQANVFGSRVRGQVYHRDLLARFFPFDARTTASLGNLIFQSQVESKKIGTRIDIETPLTANRSVNLLWGLDYGKENSQQPVAFFDPIAFDASRGLNFRKLGNRTWTPPLTTSNLGLFGQLEAKLSDRWILRGGVRNERADVSVGNFVTIANNSVTGGKVNYDETLFNLGVVYKVNPQLSAFANFSQGFSLADIGRVLRAAPNNFQFERVRPAPQKVNNYEIGVRGDWRNVQASLAAFYNTSNLGTTFNSNFVDIIRAPEQIYGLEATVDIQPSKAWNLGLSASLVEGRIDANNDGNYENFLDGFRIPPLKLTAYVENETLPGWQNRLQLLYSGTRNRFNNSTAFGRQAVGDYLTADFLTSVKVGSGTLQLGVENLLNTDYFPIVSQLQTSDLQFLPGRGRSLSVRYLLNW